MYKFYRPNDWFEKKYVPDIHIAADLFRMRNVTHTPTYTLLNALSDVILEITIISKI